MKLVIAGSRTNQVHLGALTEPIIAHRDSLIARFAAKPKTNAALLNAIDGLILSMSRSFCITADDSLVFARSSSRHGLIDCNPEWSPVP